MPPVDSRSKDPRAVEAGRRGARRRWGYPRIVRLDALSGPQRRLALALVEAIRKEAATEGQSPVTANGGGTRDAGSAV